MLKRCALTIKLQKNCKFSIAKQPNGVPALLDQHQ